MFVCLYIVGFVLFLIGDYLFCLVFTLLLVVLVCFVFCFLFCLFFNSFIQVIYLFICYYFSIML